MAAVYTDVAFLEATIYVTHISMAILRPHLMWSIGSRTYHVRPWVPEVVNKTQPGSARPGPAQPGPASSNKVRPSQEQITARPPAIKCGPAKQSNFYIEQ